MHLPILIKFPSVIANVLQVQDETPILTTPMTQTTGVLILQNDKGLFLSQDLARANYQAELVEILHGTLLGDTTWVNRGVF